MAKKTLITDGGVYHKAKKAFITVDGVYRKIKKGFITVGGIFKQVFGGGELSYYGTATALSVARGAFAATSVGDYALFGGGNTGSGTSNVVDAYNASLTRSKPTVLSQARQNLAATSIGNYALFGGGTNGSSYYSTVDVYQVS